MRPGSANFLRGDGNLALSFGQPFSKREHVQAACPGRLVRSARPRRMAAVRLCGSVDQSRAPAPVALSAAGAPWLPARRLRQGLQPASSLHCLPKRRHRVPTMPPRRRPGKLVPFIQHRQRLVRLGRPWAATRFRVVGAGWSYRPRRPRTAARPAHGLGVVLQQPKWLRAGPLLQQRQGCGTQRSKPAVKVRICSGGLAATGIAGHARLAFIHAPWGWRNCSASQRQLVQGRANSASHSCRRWRIRLRLFW